jgi:hypothetical protein
MKEIQAERRRVASPRKLVKNQDSMSAQELHLALGPGSYEVNQDVSNGANGAQRVSDLTIYPMHNDTRRTRMRSRLHLRSRTKSVTGSWKTRQLSVAWDAAPDLRSIVSTTVRQYLQPQPLQAHRCGQNMLLHSSWCVVFLRPATKREYSSVTCCLDSSACAVTVSCISSRRATQQCTRKSWQSRIKNSAQVFRSVNRLASTSSRSLTGSWMWDAETRKAPRISWVSRTIL